MFLVSGCAFLVARAPQPHSKTRNQKPQTETATMSPYADALETDRRALWGCCDRRTGNAADADALVQKTFVRAIEKPPLRTDEPLRPWLVRVAINLSRDLLRRRRRHGYAGSWLPSPVPTREESPASFEPAAPPADI